MPTYDFRCCRCGLKFTLNVSIKEKDSVKCPECNSQDVRQLFTGFNFSGGGKSCSLGEKGFKGG